MYLKGVLAVLVAAQLCSMSEAQNDYQRVALNQHKNLRAQHSAGPLAHNQRLANLAVDCAGYYAQNNNMDHSCGNNNDLGENIYMGSVNNNPSDVIKRAIDKWYAEKSKYNYNNPGFSQDTGHFTQVVWINSKTLGCGVKTANGRTAGVCLYDPRGNFGGKEDYRRNVKPR